MCHVNKEKANVALFFFFDRLERLDHLAQKFKHKCDIHEEWSYGKEDLLQAQDFKKCRLNELKVSSKLPVTVERHFKILTPIPILHSVSCFCTKHIVRS